jgi:N-acetylglucosaminyldiphosphoundecaprenol N-acetyl-beta-D-mannosaminyltransferase
MSPEEIREDISRINASHADILWIGLGAPRQEIWMNRNRQALTPAVMIGVGAAFDFISGNKPNPPRWMQNCGLGWFFRLMVEPRRLWKRYLINNPIFVGLILRQCFQIAWNNKNFGNGRPSK